MRCCYSSSSRDALPSMLHERMLCRLRRFGLPPLVEALLLSEGWPVFSSGYFAAMCFHRILCRYCGAFCLWQILGGRAPLVDTLPPSSCQPPWWMRCRRGLSWVDTSPLWLHCSVGFRCVVLFCHKFQSVGGVEAVGLCTVFILLSYLLRLWDCFGNPWITCMSL
jgi:hypothetical protein